MAYTIKEIADLAGVTTRTLRYYDEIGLLRPTFTGENGYRYYDADCLLRLQQILFFRELEVPLRDIQRIISRPDFNLLQALRNHRNALQSRVSRLDTLFVTIDRTIATIQGEKNMADKDYFEGFNESQYEQEVKERWGDTPQYAQSQRRWASYSSDQKNAIKEQGGEITRRMLGSPETAPNDPTVQAAVRDYYDYLNQYFYTCEVSFLRSLADMWVDDPRFAINYERIREGGAAFVREAVHIFCDNNG
jgi:DNA-binding transcriptional MerR regulator